MADAATRRYRCFPGLELERSGTGTRVRNPVLGYELDAPAALVKLLDAAQAPRSEAELGVDADTLAMLRSRYLLIAEDEVEVLGRGIQRMPGRPIAKPLALADLPADAGGIAFVGAPIDAGGGLGARKGPDLLRQGFAVPLHPLQAPMLLDYEQRREVEVGALAAWDVGDVPWCPDDGLATYGRRLRHVIGRLLGAGIRPLVMGGDHSITAFVLQAMLDFHPDLHLVHFDAHTDLMRTPGREPDLTHANALLFALRDARLASLLQLGVRMLEPVTAPRTAEARLSYYSARELARMDPDRVFEKLPAGAPCYISFDADVISPFEAPNTGTPEIGGLSYYQAAELFAAAARRMNIVGADFVEVAATPGGLTGTNTTALIAARLMLQLVLDFAPSRPLTHYAP